VRKQSWSGEDWQNGIVVRVNTVEDLKDEYIESYVVDIGGSDVTCKRYDIR